MLSIPDPLNPKNNVAHYTRLDFLIVRARLEHIPNCELIHIQKLDV